MMPVPNVDSQVSSADDVSSRLKLEPLDVDDYNEGGISNYSGDSRDIQRRPRSSFPVRAIVVDHNRIQFRSPSGDAQSLSVKVSDSDDASQRDFHLLSMGKKLLDCCKAGNAIEVQRLVLEGAPFIADWVGTSPLHFAVMNKHVRVTEQLLKAGICKDVRNRVDRTPLHVAAHMGLPYMVKLLLTYGGDVNCRDMLGMTPLHWVAESGNALSAKILIDYGADVFATNKFKKTAFEIASMNNHYDVTKIIQEAEQLTMEVRFARVATLKAKTLGSSRAMRPVAEILEPSAQICQEPMNKKYVLGTNEINNDVVNHEAVTVNEQEKTNEKMTTSCAIKLLKSHGVQMVKPDQNTVLSSAVLNGHTIRLTDAGKLAFKSLENKVKALDDLSDSQFPPNTIYAPQKSASIVTDLSGPTPVKISRLNNGHKGHKLHKVSAEQLIEMKKYNKIVIKAASGSKTALSSCFVNIPEEKGISAECGSSISTQNLPEGYAERSVLYIERLEKKASECERQVVVLKRQLAEKEKELFRITKQLEMFKTCSVAKS